MATLFSRAGTSSSLTWTTRQHLLLLRHMALFIFLASIILVLRPVASVTSGTSTSTRLYCYYSIFPQISRVHTSWKMYVSPSISISGASCLVGDVLVYSLAHLVSYWFPITAWFVDTATDRIPKREWDRHFHGLGLCVGWHRERERERKQKEEGTVGGTLTCLVVGYQSSSLLTGCSLVLLLQTWHLKVFLFTCYLPWRK